MNNAKTIFIEKISTVKDFTKTEGNLQKDFQQRGNPFDGRKKYADERETSPIYVINLS